MVLLLYNINTYRLGEINHGSLVLALLSVFSGLIRHKGPKLVEVDSGLMSPLYFQVELTYSLLSEICGMAKKSKTQDKKFTIC